MNTITLQEKIEIPCIMTLYSISHTIFLRQVKEIHKQIRETIIASSVDAVVGDMG